MKSAVLVFPGINRERDMARALRLISGREPAMVWHAESDCRRAPISSSSPAASPMAIICAAARSRRARRSWMRCAPSRTKGGLVLAVCNGFQIACEAGLLPGVLMRNAQLRFICRDVYLRVERSDTPFTRGYNAGQVIRVPVAHGEGNYIADGETIARLEGEGRVLFRYSSPDGMVDPNWNHNGAMNAIAGIVNERGNVLGMMPHPENHVEAVDGLHRRPRPVRGAGGSFRAGGVIAPGVGPQHAGGHHRASQGLEARDRFHPRFSDHIVLSAAMSLRSSVETARAPALVSKGAPACCFAGPDCRLFLRRPAPCRRHAVGSHIRHQTAPTGLMPGTWDSTPRMRIQAGIAQ